MPLPLPNLDDRRWQDLTQEALPLIPRYAPAWTDFNTHDPGITLMEMLAWLTESMVYRLNQIPDRLRWQFLAFIGYARRGPAPARTVLGCQPVPLGMAFELPAGAQFASVAGSGDPIIFVTQRALNLAPVTLTALQVDAGTGVLRDYSRDLIDRLPFQALGVDPPAGSAFYFGFEAIPVGSPVAFWLSFGGPGNGLAERELIVAEAEAQRDACRPVKPGWGCETPISVATDDCDAAPGPVPPHHSAVIVWEALCGAIWAPLVPVAMPARPGAGQIVDDTRSLTLDGLVEVSLPPEVTQAAVGAVATPLFYLRARLAAGAYDAPVLFAGVQPNAVAAVQRAPLWQQLTIAGYVLPLPPPPTVGAVVSLKFVLAPDLSIQSLAMQSPPAAGEPSFAVWNYVPPVAGGAGSITLAFAVAGLGTGVPSQQVYVPGAPVENRCIRVYTHDGTTWTAWHQAADFHAARRTDLFYTLNPTSGTITCGDGEHGQVFPPSSAIVVTGFAMSAASGNVSSGAITGLAQTPPNAVLLAPLSPVERAALAHNTSNAAAAFGGLPAAPIAQFEGEAAALVAAHERILDLADNALVTTLDQLPKSAVLAVPAPAQAVNLLDTERIALDVPGTVVARARAWPDTDPALPGLHATGVVTVVILPDMPIAEPVPSAGLILAVKRYLGRRRVLCTRIEVAAPTYVVVTVTASVQALTGANIATVQAAIVSALDVFLDPLTGGPAGLGWPFGRDVYNAEVLQLIANVPGVDYVNSMTLSADSSAPQCGDIALCPTFLVASGTHQITVVSA